MCSSLRPLLRHLLVLLLVLAVPFQGASAALMAIEGGHLTTQQDPFGCHSSFEQAKGPATHEPAPAQAPLKMKACGAFCLGVAPTMQFSAALAADLADRYVLPDSLAPASVIPAGLERPPKRTS